MEASRSRLKDGSVVNDRYRIDGIVGKGGFGAVYRATDLRDGSAVALKVLLSNYATSASDWKRFKREAAVVKDLAHPNIVRALDYGEAERGAPYIAFELLQGRSLADAIKEDGPFELDRALRIGIDTLRALEAAHARGIIHRDIKPQNVFLLDGPPYTKVLDFGVAKATTPADGLATQLTEAGQMVGTPQYMAPEQVRGSGLYPSSDLYSLGLLLAELLTSVRVLSDASLINIYLAHISPERLPIDARAIESPLGPVILRATEKDPALRFASATEMLGALERIAPSSGWRLAATADSDGATRALPVFSGDDAPTSKGTTPMVAMADARPERPSLVPPPISLSKTIVMEEAEGGSSGKPSSSQAMASFSRMSSERAASSSVGHPDGPGPSMQGRRISSSVLLGGHGPPASGRAAWHESANGYGAAPLPRERVPSEAYPPNSVAPPLSSPTRQGNGRLKVALVVVALALVALAFLAYRLLD